MRSQFHMVAITAVVALALAACDGGSSSPPAPTVMLTSSATDVAVGGVVTLTWSSTNTAACTLPVGEPGMTAGPAGSQSVAVAQTSTYSISCTGRGGVATASVTIHAWAPPSVSLTADPTSVVPNGTVLLTWSSQNATECRGFLGLPAELPPLPTSGAQRTEPLTETTTFRIVCGNPVFREGLAEVEVKVLGFTVLELPMQAAVDLNDVGDVVGARYRRGYPRETVVWMAGAVEVLGYSVLPGDGDNYDPTAINASRTVIGRRCPPTCVMTFSVFRWNVGGGLDPPFKVPRYSAFNDLNDAGQIVGSAAPESGAMLYSGDTVIALFGSTDDWSSAAAINGLGHIVGYFVPRADSIARVFLYAEGAIQDLGTMDGYPSYGEDINTYDEIVGYASTAAGKRAFLCANSRFTDLGSLGGGSSWPNGINDAGHIVGTSTLAGADPQAQRAFLYVDGVMHDLNGFVEPLPLPLTEALAINNRGQIIANACPPQGSYEDCRAYLLTPVALH